MEEFKPKNNHEQILSEKQKSIQEVFALHPELEKIGSREDYEKYLETIFPGTKVKDIVWHGNKESFADSGFSKDKGRDNKFSNDGQFYGFYFGDFYSHYGHSENISYPCLVNIQKLRIIDPEKDPFLSSIDTTKSIKEQYNITNEDGILEIGGNHYNKNISSEDYGIYQKGLSEKLFKHLGTTFENVEKGERIISQDEVRGYLEKEGITSLGISELVVFEPEQIHILGSKSDVEKFKEFVEKK